MSGGRQECTRRLIVFEYVTLDHVDLVYRRTTFRSLRRGNAFLNVSSSDLDFQILLTCARHADHFDLAVGLSDLPDPELVYFHIFPDLEV